MKYVTSIKSAGQHVVAPCEGAWIEIDGWSCGHFCQCVAPCEGAWIEIFKNSELKIKVTSLPARERRFKYI